MIKKWLLNYLLKNTDLVDISDTIKELKMYSKISESLELFKSRLADNIINEVKEKDMDKKREITGRILEDLHFIINIEQSETNLVKVEEFHKKRERTREKFDKLKQIICKHIK